MCEGFIIYQGHPSGINSRIRQLGIEIPKFISSTDFLLKILDKDEVKIEYEKNLGPDEPSDPSQIDKLYKERLGKFIELQKNTRFSITNFDNYDLKNLDEKIKDQPDDNLSEPFLEKMLTESKKTSVKQSLTTLNKEAKCRNQKRFLFSQIFMLIWIRMRFYYRRPMTYLIIFLRLIIGNVVYYFVFKNLGDPAYDTIVAIQNRLGFCYLLIMQFTFTGLGSSLLNFINSKKLFKKDKDSRLYDELPFFIAETSYLFPIYLVLFAALTAYYYWSFPLNVDPSLIYNSLYFCFFTFVGCFLSGESFSILIGSIANTMETASVIAPLIISPLSLASGYTGNLQTATAPIRIFSYISTIRFSFQGLALNEFQNASMYVDTCKTTIPCPKDPSKTCSVPVPDAYKSQCDPHIVTDFKQTEILTNLYIVLGLCFGFRFLAYLIFKIKSNFGKMKYKKNVYLRHKLKTIHFD